MYVYIYIYLYIYICMYIVYIYVYTHTSARERATSPLASAEQSSSTTMASTRCDRARSDDGSKCASSRTGTWDRDISHLHRYYFLSLTHTYTHPHTHTHIHTHTKTHTQTHTSTHTHTHTHTIATIFVNGLASPLGAAGAAGVAWLSGGARERVCAGFPVRPLGPNAWPRLAEGSSACRRNGSSV